MKRIRIGTYKHHIKNLQSKKLHWFFTIDEKPIKEFMNVMFKIDKTRMKQPLEY